MNDSMAVFLHGFVCPALSAPAQGVKAASAHSLTEATVHGYRI